MKLIIKKFSDTHVEVALRNAEGVAQSIYAFDTMGEANAFASGFACARHAANKAIQNLPCDASVVSE